MYDGNRGGEGLEFGRALVSVPIDRRAGELPRPDNAFQQFFADPADYVMLLNLTPMDQATAYADMRAAIEQHQDSAIFVFVHGYRVTFDDALLRTAQLAYDLGAPGAPVSFSWPANGRALDYNADEVDAEWAVAHMKDFLRDVKEDLGAKKVRIIAHSMGNRVLVGALERLRLEDVTLPIADHVVLTAPDIDAEVFSRDIFPVIRGTTDRMALYVSANDIALRASKLLAGGYPRLGDPSDGIVVLEGLETIDTSAVDDPSQWGHASFEALEVLTDLFMLLRNGLEPAARRLDDVVDSTGRVYWRLRR